MTGPTHKSVDELSDRALDVAVAREVMGLPVGEPVVDESLGMSDDPALQGVSRYSSDIAAARTVEECLRKMGGEAWSLFLADRRLLAMEGRPAAEAATLICRAALSAVRAGKQVGDDAEARWEDEGGKVKLP